MECTEFLRESGWHCATIEVPAGRCLYVSMPVTFNTGKPCDIYLFDGPGNMLTLSDDGDTMAHFNSIGYGLEDKRRWTGLRSIVSDHHFDLTEEGEITATFDRAQLPGRVNHLLQLLSALVEWERERFSEGDQDFSLTDEVERLLHMLKPSVDVTRGPRVTTHNGDLEFDFRWGKTYVDAIRPNAQSVNSRLRKAVILQGNEETELLFVIDDRGSRIKAEQERNVLGSIASVTLLSDLQHQANAKNSSLH